MNTEHRFPSFMRRAAPFVAALGALAALGLTTGRWWRSSRSLDTTASPQALGSSDELARLARRVQRLERTEGKQIAAELAQPSVRGTASDEGRGASPEPAVDVPVDPAEAKAKEREQFGVYFASLDHLREHEPRDDVWASEITKRVSDAASGLKLDGLALKVNRVDCGSRLCRIELSFEGSNTGMAPRALISLTQQLGSALPQASIFNDQDNGRATAYFARTGTSLPRMQL